MFYGKRIKELERKVDTLNDVIENMNKNSLFIVPDEYPGKAEFEAKVKAMPPGQYWFSSTLPGWSYKKSVKEVLELLLQNLNLKLVYTPATASETKLEEKKAP